MELDKKTALLISGMHRSGTSTIAGVISRLGASLPRNLMPAHPDNPKGYFESLPIVSLNDRILAECGSTWWDWRFIDTDWSINPKAARLSAEARETVAAEFGDSDFIVLKDPRIPKLLPFWHEVLESAGYRVLNIVPVRHPNEVGASIQRRDVLSADMARLTWLRHVLDAELHTRGLPRAFMLWHHFVADWETSLAGVASRLSFSWPRLSDTTRADVRSFLSRDLIHHRADRSTPDACPDCNEYVAATYAALVELADNPESGPAMARLDAVRADFLRTERIYGPYFADMDRILLGLTNHRGELLGQVSALESELAAGRAALVAEQDAHAASRAAQVAAEQSRIRAEEAAGETLARLVASEERVSALGGELQAAGQALAAVGRERDSLQESLRRAEAAQVRLAGEVEAATRDLLALRTDHSLLTSTIADLQARLARLREEARSAAERLAAHNALSRWQKINAALKGAGA